MITLVWIKIYFLHTIKHIYNCFLFYHDVTNLLNKYTISKNIWTTNKIKQIQRLKISISPIWIYKYKTRDEQTTFTISIKIKIIVKIIDWSQILKISFTIFLLIVIAISINFGTKKYAKFLLHWHPNLCYFDYLAREH